MTTMELDCLSMCQRESQVFAPLNVNVVNFLKAHPYAGKFMYTSCTNLTRDHPCNRLVATSRHCEHEAREKGLMGAFYRVHLLSNDHTIITSQGKAIESNFFDTIEEFT